MAKDSHQAPPMKVLCLGMGRTGTTSLKLALEELGYQNVYDFGDIVYKDQSAVWHEAVRAKFHRGEKVDFRRGPLADVLRDSEAGADLPFALFYEELLDQFPDADVILTTRPVDAWVASAKQTVAHPMMSSTWFRVAGWLEWRYGRMFNLYTDYNRQVWGDDFDKYGPRAFTEHNDAVRRLAAAGRRRVLEYVPGQGWGPLCKFLGKPVPKTEYPHSWTTAEYRGFAMHFVNGIYIQFARRVALGVIPALAAAAYWYWYL